MKRVCVCVCVCVCVYVCVKRKAEIVEIVEFNSRNQLLNSVD